ncbi:carbon starvation protein A [Fulvitalea axinellae]|uniref:Carbon starvation protein A n=1 Tax=Fulvitalea axinellae TaxID=1182444 RepID=A0AAU9CKG7_9BACT|nr:carbon starvation protein A [Fulvitalea axinellae]
MAYIFLGALLLFFAAYKFYGGFLDKTFGIDDSCPTPSHSDYDGVDRVPTKKGVLLGHHFASIAGAGPIVGPIIAGLAFGWLPALLWIVLGTIFIGGVHDYTSLIASVRHKAKSVAEIVRLYMSPFAYRMMLVFIWLALVYILIVFVDLTATSFANKGEVASASGMFVALALIFGYLVFRKGLPSGKLSLIFVPILFGLFALSFVIPADLSALAQATGISPRQWWSIGLLLYCVAASVLPVWVLLQPRDYLSSFLLYAAMIGALVGLFLGGFELSYPAFTDWSTVDHGTLFPILFITIACGACSGFHSIVSSGTTSKQLDKETDARPVGYGAMLIEGALAVIALFTVAMLSPGSEIATKSPLAVYGAGMGRFLNTVGLPVAWGESFGMLTISTFLLTTLDTSTRLARYVFEEFFGLKGGLSKYVAIGATLALPIAFVFMTMQDASGNPIPVWKAIWPVFGATNQLLAALALLVVYVWLRKTGKPSWFVAGPLLFMLTMTLWALTQLVLQSGFTLIGIVSAVLLILAIVMVMEAVRVVFLKAVPEAETVDA